MDTFVKLPASERLVFFQETAARMGLGIQIIEKDFWVCWTLAQLFALPETGNHLTFKGGTSLSKAFHVIERFSEDIDVSLDREFLGFGGERSPEATNGSKERKRRLDALKKACQEKIAGDLRSALTITLQTKLPSQEWSLAFDNADSDRQTLLFSYPASGVVRATGYVVPRVKIEMGAKSDHWPCLTADITSYVAEHFPQAFSNAAVKARVLAAERTFWEKVTLLHAEFHRPTNKPLPSRLSRHYYDVERLIANGVAKRAAADLDLLQRVVEHKSVFFRSNWANYQTAQKGALRLVPSPERLDEWRIDYEKMGEMFFTKQIPFGEIIKTVREFEETFNGT